MLNYEISAKATKTECVINLPPYNANNLKFVKYVNHENDGYKRAESPKSGSLASSGQWSPGFPSRMG